MPPFPIDPDATVQKETAALIATPRKNRKRFPEACVTPVENESEATQKANPEKNLHAAVVYGPSVSSESQRIYHLIRWLG